VGLFRAPGGNEPSCRAQLFSGGEGALPLSSPAQWAGGTAGGRPSGWAVAGRLAEKRGLLVYRLFCKPLKGHGVNMRSCPFLHTHPVAC
jgi:hypothetical protein